MLSSAHLQYMNIPENILVLIEKYQNNTATPEEKYLLDEWYHSFNDVKTEIITTEDLTEFMLGDKIRNKIAVTVIREKNTIPGKSRRRWISAAASVILLISIGAFFLLSNKFSKQDIAKSTPVDPKINDLAPGGNKAILTLADGSTIVLDNASDGMITQQGNIKIHKLGNGLLAYTINGKQVTENDEAFYNTISTPRGGQYQVTLADGSIVWLNAASSIRFPVVFIGQERKVEVTGEAYFEVATSTKEGNKLPFIVKLNSANKGQSTIEVLGTHFNVNAYEDETVVKTTLLEGKVKVLAPENSGKQSSAILMPGQQAGISQNKKISVIDNADTEEAVAWKNGRFQFKSADLNSILRQISRWYDVDIVYKDKVDLHFTGQLTRNDNASKVFEKLKLTGEVNFEIDGKNIIVSH